MGLVDFIEDMRKKPIAERRKFAAAATFTVMAAVTLVWFIFFFANVSELLTNPAPSAGDEVAAPISAVGKKPAAPF